MDTTEQNSATKTLDGIIRELSSYPGKQQDNSETQVITIDAETGEIVDRPPLISLLRKFRFFEINRAAVLLNVQSETVNIDYKNMEQPIEIQISYKAKLNDRGAFHLVRFVRNFPSPHAAINKAVRDAITSFVFDHADFVINLTKYKPDIEELVKNIGAKAGLILWPQIKTNIPETKMHEQFVPCSHVVNARTKDGQTVEIRHDLALTQSDPIRISLSKIPDIQAWIRNKLDQYTNNVIIDMTYADVLVSMQDTIIKIPMQQACREIGYELKQLITVPGLEIEKFYFETGESGNTEFGTRDVRLKIALNIIVDGRIDLRDDKTKRYIRKDYDIIASLKKNVIEYSRIYINDKTPDDCFMQQYQFEDELVRLLRHKLEANYGFKELNILIKFLETDLSKRFAALQERSYSVKLRADWTEREFELWFRIMDVSKDGWYRFRANNYKDTEEELSHIGRMVRNGMEQFLLRPPSEISEKHIGIEFKKVQQRVRSEFGLEITLCDFVEDLSDQEKVMIGNKKAAFQEESTRAMLMLQNETKYLAWLLDKKNQAIEDEEPKAVIDDIQKKIGEINNKSNYSKAQFISRKTGNGSLLSGDAESDSSS